MADEMKPLRCHKNLDHDCMRTECPMWFVPPNPNAEGDCAEALVIKDDFWQRIKSMADNMRAEAMAKKEEPTPES